MFDIVLHAFLASLPVYLFFSIGFLLRKRGSLTLKDEKAITHLALDVAYPCLVFSNLMKYIVVQGDEVLSSPIFCLQAMGCGFLEMSIGVLVAYVVARVLRLKIGRGLRTFVVSAGLQNYIFFVVPVLQMISLGSDDPSMGVLFVHNAGCEIFLWTLAVFLMSGDRENLRLGNLLRGPLIAVIGTLCLIWLGLGSFLAQAPILKTAEMLGAVASPICLIICGCSIYDLSRNFTWQPRMLTAGMISRLLIAPMLIMLAAWALPVDPMIKRIMVIQGSIPSAVVSVVLAKRFGGIPELSTQLVLSTTVVSIVTFPLWLAVGDRYVTPIFS